MLNYFISEDELCFFERRAFFGGYYVSYCDSTDVYIHTSSNNSSGICVIGYCIDAKAEVSRKLIAKYLHDLLSRLNNNWLDFVKEISHLAGDFVIAVYCPNYFRVVNDATGRMGIYYSSKVRACSSSDTLLAKYVGAKLSTKAKKIRLKAASDGQPLPYNITDYEEVYISLPNYYLDLNELISVRFFPTENFRIDKGDLSIEDCLERSYNLVKNIADAYGKDRLLICPLTAGWDSRVNYSYFFEKESLQTFTLMLPDFNDRTPDVYVPKQFLFNLDNHKILKFVEANLSSINYVRENTTPNPGKGAISFALTILSQYKNLDYISGDIIDQIGGSLIGNKLPDFFATKSFFKCKIHNYSDETEVELKKWMRSANDSNISLYDLFAWESRLGRWAHEKNKIGLSCNVRSVNIYNCREVLELWLRIPRDKRSDMIIHKYYLGRNAPALLDSPFNPNDRLGWLKNTRITFLMATYIKYYIGLLRNKN